MSTTYMATDIQDTKNCKDSNNFLNYILYTNYFDSLCIKFEDMSCLTCIHLMRHSIDTQYCKGYIEYFLGT
jgi:hypothetical protein